MRNKSKFIEDAYPYVKEQYREELNVVEDAALVMRHSGNLTYTIPAELTVDENPRTFVFERIERPATDNPEMKVEDYMYVGEGA